MNATVAFITGGAQGIGRAVAARLLRRSYCVAIADADEEAGGEAQSELSALGRVTFVHADVADEDAVRAAVQHAVSVFGGIDALVNNAGIMVGRPVTELTLAQWHRVLDVNLTSIFLTAKYAASHLKARHGAIVNIASTRALMSEANTEAYSASKGGVVALTHALAASLGPEVRVNCVSPGWIDTSALKKASARRPRPMTAQDHAQHLCGRVGAPDDVAALVAFLAGPESGFMTGANIVLDGGMTRKMIYVE